MKNDTPYKPFIRSPYNYDRDLASDSSALHFDDPSLTKQEFLEETDPNFILDRFLKGGDITLNPAKPNYGDFTNAPDSYHAALNTVTEARNSFMELDARIRAKFDNDPGKFLAFVSDPKNLDQLVEMGLAEPRPVEAAVPAGAERSQQAGAAPAGTDAGQPAPASKKASKAAAGDSKGGD